MQINRYTSYNNTSARPGRPQFIVIHYTGSGSSRAGSALANCKYFSGGNRNASADFFVDDSGIWQYNPDIPHRYAWVIGDGHGRFGKTNANSISIEVCNNGGEYTGAEKSYLQQLVRSLMAEYGIPASRVVRHWDCSRKCCPAPYAPNGEDGSGARWSSLHALVTGGGAIDTSGASDGGSPAGAGDQVPRYIDVDGSGGHNTAWLLQYEAGVRSGESKDSAVLSGQSASDDRWRPAWRAVEHGGGGSLATRQVQRLVGANPDGKWGYDTSGRVQQLLRDLGYGIDVDHSFGPASMRALQDALNHGWLFATWLYGSKGWWYALGTSKRYAVGWRRIAGSWYFFDADGWMLTGWVQDGGKWYCMHDDGHMAVGWIRDGGTGRWFWSHEDGAIVSSCTEVINGTRYTFAADGHLEE